MTKTLVGAAEPDDYDTLAARYREQHRALMTQIARALRAAGSLGRRT